MNEKKSEVLDTITKIITSCKNVEERSSDPFAIDVVEGIELLRKVLPMLKNIEELSLDGEAFYRLVVILGLQEVSLRNRASSLYSDPFLVNIKLKAASIEGLAEAFLRSWRPVASSECINYEMLRESYAYWNGLRRISLRGVGERAQEKGIEALEEMGLLEEQDIMTSVLKEYEELKSLKEEISYEDFIAANEVDERLDRAIILSYLITFGYVDVRIDPISSKIWLKAKEKPIIPDQAEKSSIVFRVDGVGRDWAGNKS